MSEASASVKPIVVLVTSSFPIRNDGSEAAGSFVADLACALAVHVQVRVVAPGTVSGREDWHDGVQVWRFASPEKPLSTLRPWLPRDVLWLVKVIRGGQLAINDAMQGTVARVIALWGLPCGEWARRAASKAGVPYTVWMLGSDVWSLGRMPVLRLILRRVIRQAAHAVADGYQLADDASQIAGVPVGFLPTTRALQSSTTSAPRANKPYRLLFLGRWHANKGVDLLLDALSLLSDQDWEGIESVDIQGGGGMDSLVRSRVAKLTSESRPVRLGGFLSKPAAEAAIAGADWVLIPSRIESIPVVFSDAMKLGKPVVCTPVGDLARLVTSFECGFHSAQVDAYSYALALRGALNSDASCLRQGIEAAAAQFSLERIASELASDVVAR